MNKATILNPIRWQEVSGVKASGFQAKQVMLNGVGQQQSGRRVCLANIGITADGQWVASCQASAGMPIVKVSGKYATAAEAKTNVVAIFTELAMLIENQVRNNGILKNIN